MTKLTVQCPNAACRRVSPLGDDPLGRIFRCPRCLTKLPSAPAAAGDSRWTAVLGPPRPSLDNLSFRRMPAWRWAEPASANTAGASARSSSGFESGEVLIGAVDFDCEHKQSLVSGGRA